MARKKQEIILENVVIEAVAAEGKALARIDGTVLFVQFAVPGDIVDVKVTKKKKNYMEGFILRIVKPSEHRLEPFCRHFGICGGCKWQPLPYGMQLQAKQQQVYDQLVRIGHLDAAFSGGENGRIADNHRACERKRSGCWCGFTACKL